MHRLLARCVLMTWMWYTPFLDHSTLVTRGSFIKLGMTSSTSAQSPCAQRNRDGRGVPPSTRQQHNEPARMSTWDAAIGIEAFCI